MDLSINPSLKHAAVIKIVITLWNKVSVASLKEKYHYWAYGNAILEWEKVEVDVIQEVSKLALPELLKKEILKFIKPVGLELIKWKVYHCQNYQLNVDLPHELCLTPQKTVDLKKTAEACIKDEILNIDIRYKLACIWCLENDIKMLWNKFPMYFRESFYKVDCFLALKLYLVTYWTNVIKGEVNSPDNNIPSLSGPDIPYLHVFEKAAVSGNKVVTEYFFQKLTTEERQKSLVRTTSLVVNQHFRCNQNNKILLYAFPIESYSEVFCFLLSHIDEAQQMEIFMGHPYGVLRCFLDWPYQSSFIESVRHMMHLLCASEFEKLIKVIVDKALYYGYTDNNYHKIFEIFWQQDSFKYQVVVSSMFDSGSLLSNLFELEDTENITLILNSAIITEKELFIFSDRGKDICETLISKGNWSLLRLFVNKSLSSKEITVKFREEFMERKLQNISEGELITNESMWEQFFHVLNEFI